jgi:activating signal cointegrator 1
MKAISLWQPWASAMALGCKRNETRSWPTKYRGDLIICSAQHRIAEIGLDTAEAMLDSDMVNKETDRSVADSLNRLPYGAALCVVDLYDCRRSDEFAEFFSPARLDKRERLWGNYDFGRWVWMTRNCRRLAKPVPVKGKQGLFELSEQEAKAVMEQLKHHEPERP